jgi:hypothetical protein
MHIAAAAFANSQRLGFIVSAYSAVCPPVGPKRASRHAGAAAACMQWLPGPLCSGPAASKGVCCQGSRSQAACSCAKGPRKHQQVDVETSLFAVYRSVLLTGCFVSSRSRGLPPDVTGL